METTQAQIQQTSQAISTGQGDFNTQSSNYNFPFQTNEINLLEYIFVLLKNKWLIFVAALAGIALGYAVAVIKGPSWVSEALISAKEQANSSSTSLSSLGIISGMVASQLNIAGSPGLDKIEIALDSKKFHAALIEKYNLLPLVYKNSWPDIYRDSYDSIKGTWSENFVKPNLLKIGKHLKDKYLKKTTNTNRTLSLSFESRDSLFSDTLLSSCLNYLNYYLQTSIQNEAHENVKYLESQLIMISDPLLREKLQSMIALELEKTMLVSSEAFRIIDPLLTYKKFNEIILYPIMFSVGLALLTSFIVIFLHALLSGFKTKDDIEWMNKIRSQLKLNWPLCKRG